MVLSASVSPLAHWLRVVLLRLRQLVPCRGLSSSFQPGSRVGLLFFDEWNLFGSLYFFGFIFLFLFIFYVLFSSCFQCVRLVVGLRQLCLQVIANLLRRFELIHFKWCLSCPRDGFQEVDFSQVWGDGLLSWRNI